MYNVHGIWILGHGCLSLLHGMDFALMAYVCWHIDFKNGDDELDLMILNARQLIACKLESLILGALKFGKLGKCFILIPKSLNLI